MSDYQQMPTNYGPTGPDHGKTAAILLWIIGAIEFLLMGCCSCGFLVFGFMPAATIRDVLEQGQASEQDIQVILSMKTMLAIVGAINVLIFAIPGLVLFALAFNVRQGGRRAAKAARAIVIAQAVLIVIGIATTIVMAVLGQPGPGADPLSIVFNLALLGLLIWAAVVLTRVIRYGGGDGGGGLPGGDLEPWNRHLSDRM